MPGPKPLAPLDVKFAATFRQIAKRLIEEKGVDRASLGEAMAYLPARSERWVNGALAPSAPLFAEHALEISARLQRLNVRLPDHLLEELLAKRRKAAILVFPGETERLVDALMSEVRSVNGYGTRSAARLERKFTALFQSYERFNETATGREIVRRLKYEMQLVGTRNWMNNYTRFAEHLEADGDQTTIPSLPKLVDAAVRERLARKKTSRAQ